jgi:putative flippase GtrA
MNPTHQPVLVVPAYQPSALLIGLISKLQKIQSERPIVIVDDGSTGMSQDVILRLKSNPHVTVLQHAVNLGKGQALKTAFNYVLTHFPNSIGVVTADADGQHAAEDIHKIADQFILQPTALWLGARYLGKDVPMRSRIGNALTQKIFRGVAGKKIHDTQTGLRGIPAEHLPQLMRIKATGYEFELDMLLQLIAKNIAIQEMVIQTIYIDDNKSSHFNPFIDSVKVYFVFLRYLLASIASAGIDFISFLVFNLATHKLFLSLCCARVISGICNFVLCKKLIFKSAQSIYGEAFKYFLLALFSLCLAYGIVLGLRQILHCNIYFSKILADVSVFLINFVIQRILIFTKLPKV